MVPSKLRVTCVYGGFVAAPSAIEYAKNIERGETETNGIYDAELKRQSEINDQIIRNEGGENQYKLHEEMGKVMNVITALLKSAAFSTIGT